MLNRNSSNVLTAFIPQLYWKYLSSTSANYSESQQNTSSKKTDAEKEQEQKKPGAKERLKRILALKKHVPDRVMEVLRLEPGSPSPTTLSFIDEQSGPEQSEIDVPMGKVIREIPSFVRKNTKELAQICRENMHFHQNNPDFLASCEGAAHTETAIQYQFRTESDMKKWKTACDSDTSMGFSKCDLYKSDRGTAIFEGILSKRLVKDGKAKRAGWCSMKSIDRNPFVFKKHYDWENYSHLIIKCRGDGRSYKIMLYTALYMDVTWGDTYNYPLHTHGGPYWQYEKIPFSRFFYSVGGRVMDKQYPITESRISSIGIVLMDRIEGPFRLEIDFIGAYNDISHMEEFAYELYNQPATID